MFEKLLDIISEGITVYEDQGTIIWCNNAATRILKQDKEHLLDKNIRDIFPHIDSHSKGDLIHVAGENKEILLSDSLKLAEKNKLVNVVLFREEKVPTLTHDSSPLKLDKPKYIFSNLIGKNKQFCEVISIAKKAALTSSPVLVHGETGTGKELFAQSIHNASERFDKPFVAINCAAIPENLLEGILFGTVKGAFTEAVNRPGLFEQASQGTIFFDEINSMSLNLQAKLLRVIQEKTVRRVGGVKDIPVDPRIISSLNIEPLEAMENGILRSDLFYRLSVVYISIPPLQARKDDIPLLTKHFIKKISQKLNRPVKTISPEVLEVIENYEWPGNIRQLEHAIECAINFIDTESEIALEHFPQYLSFVSNRLPVPTSSIAKNKILRREIEEIERSKIIRILQRHKGNISRTARDLGVSRQSLYYRMRKYSIAINKKTNGYNN